MQPARDHQVQYKPQIILYADADSLSQSSQRNDLLSFHCCERRIRGPEKKWRIDQDALKRAIQNSLLKRFDVDGDIRKFRHEGYELRAKQGVKTNQ